MSLARLILAFNVDDWPPDLLATFASQFGSPSGYTLMERAKLVGQYGVVARLLDIVQQATLAPFAKREKPPSSVLPSVNNKDTRMSESRRKQLIDVLGIERHGEGLKDGEWADYSDSVD